MLEDELLHEGERLDELDRSNLKIIQDPARFCFGSVPSTPSSEAVAGINCIKP